jgi:hypothetical protein
MITSAISVIPASVATVTATERPARVRNSAR